MPQDIVHELQTSIENCLLRELVKDYDECEYHGEYHLRMETLEDHILEVRNVLKEFKLNDSDHKLHNVLSLLIILHKELQTNGPWNTEKSKEFANDINNDFQALPMISIDYLLRENIQLNNQKIFDNCMENVHKKLTLQKFKKYPSIIDVYCALIDNLNSYRVKISPAKTLPAALLLIEDYMPENKIKGLICCRNILKCLNFNDFVGGNYYEVIYANITKLLQLKDLDIIKLVLDCISEMLRIFPMTIKKSKSNQLLSIIIDEIFMETNFYRKKALFTFLRLIISQHKTDSVKRKNKFMSIVCENLDLCMNESIRPVLLNSLLECLQTWLKYCWCVWNFATDVKVLSVLLKLLYVLDDKEEKNIITIQQIIFVLLNLCSEEDQSQILLNIEGRAVKFNNERYLARFKEIVKRFDNKC